MDFFLQFFHILQAASLRAWLRSKAAGWYVASIQTPSAYFHMPRSRFTVAPGSKRYLVAVAPKQTMILGCISWIWARR